MSEETKNTEEKSTAQTNEQAPDNQLVSCPCCGKKTLQKPINVNGKVLDQFLACIQTGQSFTNAYKLFNGHIIVTLTQFDKHSANIVSRVCKMLDMYAKEHTENTLEFHLAELKDIIQSFCSVISVEVSSNGNTSVFNPSEHVFEECNKLLAAGSNITEDILEESYKTLSSSSLMSNIPAITLSNTISVHNQLYMLLMESAFDENFWKGIELA